MTGESTRFSWLRSLNLLLSLLTTFFRRFHPHHLSAVFVDSNIDTLRFFEIDHLFNKQTIKRGRGLRVKYLVCWTGYGQEWDRWYIVKDLNNVAKLVRHHDKSLAQQEHWHPFRWRRGCHGFYPYLSLLLILIPFTHSHNFIL